MNARGSMKRVLLSVAVGFVIVAAIVFVFGGYIAEKLGLNFGHPLHPPAIAQGIDFNWPGNWDDNPEWTAKLARNFPAGSSEATLQATLRDEGFQIDEPAKSAEYRWGGMPCLYTLRVDWKAKDRKIASVNGGFGMGCL